MIKSLRTRISQGKQYVPDIRNAKPNGFIGLPEISTASCPDDCNACQSACPTEAIKINPVQIDLGRCTFCNECTWGCPSGKISFTQNFKMSSHSRDGLFVSEKERKVEVRASDEIKKLFGRSLRLRSVSAGGCNGCELEMNAVSNVNFDISRFGVEFVASPRHADGLVLSGPITKNMAQALELAYEGMPDPKFIIAVGACGISGGLFDGADGVDRSFLDKFKPDLYVPGCPPHPLTFINGLLDLLGRR